MRNPLPADTQRILAAQALRAFAYGFGAVLLGVTLHQRGFSATLVGVVLTAVVAGTVALWVLLAASLTGALSTEVVESGPFTSLEQPMLATGLARGRQIAGFGLYNAVATAAGSLGALVAARLSPAVEAPAASSSATPRRRPVERSRPVVYRLCALFAVDSLGGGFVIQAFV